MPLKIAYWSIRGLGAPLRMMCEYTETPYEAVLYDVAPKEGGGFDASAWFDKKPAIKAKNPLANLPYIEDDGNIITQSNACMTYLASKLGLYGVTSQDRIEADQLLCEAMDLRNNMVKVFYGGGDLNDLISSSQISKLNAWLEAKGTTFLVGSTPTAPDFHVFELLDQLNVLAGCNGLASWGASGNSALSSFYTAFESLPFMAKYKESSLSKLPINNKMAKFGAAPSGAAWDHANPESFDADSKFRGSKNAAFVFIKPHAVTPAVISLVKGYFAGKGITVLSEGRIASEEIDSKKLIDQHYYAIASKATILKPHELNVPTDKFEAQFGLTWEAALAAGNVYNAMDACAVLGITGDEMDAQWGICKKAKKLVKFGGGFYCGLVEIEGKPSLYVFNGFFMSMRSKFTVPGEGIHFFSVEWDGNQLPWTSFRAEALGPTDPADAPMSSLRGMVLRDWESLGLNSLPNVGDNGVHASASPFEALAERMNWLGASIDADPFGSSCLAAGLSEETIRAWSVDPQVQLPSGGKGSLFDAVEDMDVKQCLATLISIDQCSKN
jgi:glutathione S-transferase/nucleoside diphosphate kinase